jgi:acetoin utilization deacetylase AcuC-like enzyme
MTRRRTLLLQHERCLGHAPPPGHPESPERLRRALAALAEPPAGALLRPSRCRAERSHLERIHDPVWIDRLLALDGRSAEVDPNTFVSPGSVEAMLAAVGASVELVDEVIAGRAQNGLALVRPPGHHALPAQPMGYCLVNNVAIAAAHALALGLSRVLVVDWDVHHGNGTQHIFYERADVLFVDFHQEELFPPGGGHDERGAGAGAGYTVNLPLPSGCTDGEYLFAAERLLPALGGWYRPELVLVSCGFDPHAGDPEGGMDLSPAGFAALTAVASRVAERWAGGRIAMVLEGGYLLDALGPCVRAVVETLAGAPPPRISPHASPSVRRSVERALEGLRAAGVRLEEGNA